MKKNKKWDISQLLMFKSTLTMNDKQDIVRRAVPPSEIRFNDNVLSVSSKGAEILCRAVIDGPIPGDSAVAEEILGAIPPEPEKDYAITIPLAKRILRNVISGVDPDGDPEVARQILEMLDRECPDA